MRNLVVRSLELGVGGKKAHVQESEPCGVCFLRVLTVVLCALSVSGCVRVAGTAGYWRPGQDGQLESKQASFDTNNLVQKGKTPGSITL